MLDDKEHIEAIAMVNALLENPDDPYVIDVATQWVHGITPGPDVYMNALISFQQEAMKEETNG